MNWNLPNILSVMRVLAAPVIALTFVFFDRPLADQLAVVVFIAAAATDYFDGWLARTLGQESAFGKMLDPIADKAMVLIALALLAALYDLRWPVLVPAVIIILREVLISGLREFLGDVKLEVTRLAKWKTTLQMVAVCLLLVQGAVQTAPDAPTSHPIVEQMLRFVAIATTSFGTVVLWIAAWFTVVTGWDYFRKGLPYIREKDRAAHAATNPSANPGGHASARPSAAASTSDDAAPR